MFLLSVLCVILSSYFFLSIIHKRSDDKNFPGFLYIILLAFAQIIISFEVLSLLKIISVNGFLLFNIIFLITSILFFFFDGRYVYKPDIRKEISKIIYSFKTDKILCITGICYIVFLIFELIHALLLPVLFGDALTYNLPRVTSWIQNGSINHFITPDSRELIMPVNMELLYTWKLLFTGSEIAVSFFPYIGYLTLVYVVYSFLKELNFSVRKRLWAIFVLSSFPLIPIEMHTPSADVTVGAFILSCIYLFYKSSKNNTKFSLYFSSLSYAVAVGIKTTAVIAMPVTFIVIAVITVMYKKDRFYSHLFKFFGLFLVNFLIFSSYNYILNIIHFSNPVSNSEQLLLNKFRGAFKGWLVNLIKYIFVIFDTSGIKDVINFNVFVEYMQDKILSLFGENLKSYSSLYFPYSFVYDEKVGYMRSALGLMGILAFLPSLFKSLKKTFDKNKTEREKILALLSLSLILNIVLFAGVMVFTSFNIRYLLTFAVIATPALVYSYIRKKTVFKVIMAIIMFVYLIVISHKLPVSYIISDTEQVINGQNQQNSQLKEPEIKIYSYLLQKNPSNIALVAEQVANPVYYIEKLRLHGVHIDKLLIENIEEYKLQDYEYIVVKDFKVSSTNIVNFKERMKYADLFVGRCNYFDYEQNIIQNTEVKPAMVDCLVPHEYFARKGFQPVKDFETEHYLILENTNN